MSGARQKNRYALHVAAAPKKSTNQRLWRSHTRRSYAMQAEHYPYKLRPAESRKTANGCAQKRIVVCHGKTADQIALRRATPVAAISSVEALVRSESLTWGKWRE